MGKKFVVGDPGRHESLYAGALSMTLSKALNLVNVPLAFLRDIWFDAEYIVAERKIQSMPIGATPVIGYSDNAIVTNGKCNCDAFRLKNCICSHTIAIENEKNNLLQYLGS